ncbi:gas vesicle protein [Streptomyces marincola]|uniref:gas vesicle protein n=1 Tax=Streptomyces marincola TaxID=2878388 RepID=UPI001CF411DD|nr:gas vesicle protein [Streptomyces marincola]UCM87013.1 gas vesicle protein [Streptomyces marincola]
MSDELASREIALVDLLDRLLAGGVVLAGHLTLRIADVDLVRIDLRAMIASVASLADDAQGGEPVAATAGGTAPALAPGPRETHDTHTTHGTEHRDTAGA